MFSFGEGSLALSNNTSRLDYRYLFLPLHIFCIPGAPFVHAHFNTSRCPRVERASAHVLKARGQPFLLAHFNTSRRPFAATVHIRSLVYIHSLQGQSLFLIHFITPMCPFLAANLVQVPISQGHPFELAQLITLRCPFLKLPGISYLQTPFNSDISQIFDNIKLSTRCGAFKCRLIETVSVTRSMKAMQYVQVPIPC